MQMNNPQEAHESLKARSRSPYRLWLIWVVWLPFIYPAIVQLFQAHPTLPLLIVTLVGTVLFFGVYLWATWRTAQRLVAASSLAEHTEAWTWLAMVVLMVLSFALALLGRGYQWIGPFIFTSGYVSGSLPTVRAAAAVIVLILLAVVAGWLSGLGWFDFGQAVVFIAAVGVVTRIVVWSITTSWELQAAREEIARLAVMTERLRIARDLHDLLGHNLSLIALKSELARRLVGVAPERAAVEIGDIEQVARTTLQEVREAVASYRQPTLSSELQGAQEILAAAGIAYQYEGDESSMGTLPTTIEAVLAWTVREGVTNVIRHSHAHQCTIHMRRERDMAFVEVTDDGAGVALASTAKPEGALSTGNGGHGLRGLAERVDALGGRFEAGPRAGGGFRLAVSVPLAQRAGVPATTPDVGQGPIELSEHSGGYEERSEQ